MRPIPHPTLPVGSRRGASVPETRGPRTGLRAANWLAVLGTLVACRGPMIDATPPVAVTVVVDYGSPSLPILSEQLLLPAGTSPVEALAALAEVDQAYVTRTAQDVWSVDGVATDVEAGYYWDWHLNGRRTGQAPYRYTLRNGDQITWRYRPGEPPDYRN